MNLKNEYLLIIVTKGNIYIYIFSWYECYVGGFFSSLLEKGYYLNVKIQTPHYLLYFIFYKIHTKTKGYYNI